MERRAIGLIAISALTGCASWHPEYDQIRPVAHIEVAGKAKVGSTFGVKVWYIGDTTLPEDTTLGNISLDEAGRVGWVSVRIHRAAYFGPGFLRVVGCCESLDLGLKPSAAGTLRLAAKEPHDGPFTYNAPGGNYTLPPTHDILVNVEPGSRSRSRSERESKPGRASGERRRNRPAKCWWPRSRRRPDRPTLMRPCTG